MSAAVHTPVLRDEVIAALAPAAGELHIDGTFGAGGYTRSLLDAGAKVVAFDRDPDAIAEGQALVAESGGRLRLVARPFSEMADELGENAADGLTLDIGVSSRQLDRAERGFSFQADGPLDMRMSRAGESAADFLNAAPEGEIARMLKDYGDEPRAGRVARAIVAARPLATTGALAAVVRRALGHRPHEKTDPATRTFQAVRIHVNRELGELEDGLAAAEQVLKPGGRLAVVSFHSAEDRIVKRFLRDRSGGGGAGSRHRPEAAAGPRPSFEGVARPVRPSEAEILRNPRSRSATLRVARRTAAPSWPPPAKGTVR